ncbi:hypothetical protein [Oceanobacillus kimchii]|uniref:hypothetical protein n=1 Tax=Oceanobacillus kimchii TaxID=746691 RepID=UPI003B01ED2D
MKVLKKKVLSVCKLEPKEEASLLTGKEWEQVTPYEKKMELWDGIAFDPSGQQRDRLCVSLIYNMGLQHLVEILPDTSKEILKELL